MNNELKIIISPVKFLILHNIMKCITASLLVVTLGLSVHADPVPVTIGMPTGEDLEAMFAIAVSLYVVKILHFLLVFLDYY